MVISAFTYVRNGLAYAYPFIESIKSLLPLVDEYIVVVGDSTDGTREAVAAIGDERIKIVDTVWDEKLRTGGKVFAQQANTGMDHCRADADWLFHLQADEVLHEKDLEALRDALTVAVNNPRVDGLLFPFIHFYGDYAHYCPSRRYHKYEIRAIKNNPAIRSYRDSMGFRKYQNPANQEGEPGQKLYAQLVPVTIYHYSWARPPKKLTAKRIAFGKAYNSSDDFIEALNRTEADGYAYREYDYLREFTGTHPAVMQPVVAAQDWSFVYDPKRNNMAFKERLLRWIEERTGWRLFTYKNYRILRD